MSALRRLGPRQIIVIIAVLIAGVAGAYYLTTQLSGEQASGGLTENEQLIAVTRGELISQVQTGGTLSFPTKEALRIGTGTIVKDVLIEEGQTVIEGQALLTLDDATVAERDMDVAKARIALREATEALDNLLTDAKEEMADAETGVSDAQKSLIDVQQQHDDIVSDAQTGLDEAEQAYSDTYDAWLGVPLSTDELALSPDDILAQWGLDLDALFDDDAQPDIDQGIFAGGSPSDDPATPWSETVVYGVVNFYPGEIAPTCEDTDAHPLNGHCLQKGFEDAWDDLTAARDALDDANDNRAAAVRKAEDTLDTAQDRLGEAEQAMQDAGEGETGYMRHLREAEVVSARIALDDALERREEATLRAPFAGIVAELNAEAGQPLEGNTGIAIEIIDTSVVELVGQVDETDVLRVQEGDAAEITLDALPGQTFSGELLSVSSGAESLQGIALFTVTIRVTAPPGMILREGMNANARMLVDRRENVLLVPVQSIYGTFQEPLLRVFRDGGIISRSVTLGSNDGFWVIVESGAEEGEEVIMHVAGTDEFLRFSDGPGGFQRAGAVRVARP